METNDMFRTVGLIGRPGSDLVVDTMRQLLGFLDSADVTVVLDSQSAALVADDAHQVAARKMMGEICDLVIVVGGDGCLLGAARDFCRYKVPLLGVNRGRLGFLTDISPHDLEERMREVFAGDFLSEWRFLLDAQIVRDGKPVAECLALNDVVFHTGNSVKMLEFELLIEGQFVYRQRSDGLIISTPTGSTAYALSGGGPIMHPRLDALVLVPMFPHTLSSRPLVVDANSEIKVEVSMNNETRPRLSCDGQGDFAMEPGDTLYVRKKSPKIRLIHPLNHDFYESCRSKLGWSEVL